MNGLVTTYVYGAISSRTAKTRTAATTITTTVAMTIATRLQLYDCDRKSSYNYNCMYSAQTY